MEYHLSILAAMLKTVREQARQSQMLYWLKLGTVDSRQDLDFEKFTNICAVRPGKISHDVEK